MSKPLGEVIMHGFFWGGGIFYFYFYIFELGLNEDVPPHSEENDADDSGSDDAFLLDKVEKALPAFQDAPQSDEDVVIVKSGTQPVS